MAKKVVDAREQAIARIAEDGEQAKTLRRLCGRIRVGADQLEKRLSKSQLRELRTNLREAVDEGDDEILYRQTRLILHEAATLRRQRAKELDYSQDSLPLVDPKERLRTEVFAKELARQALRFMPTRDSFGNLPEIPLVVRFRETCLEGRTLTEEEAGLFIDCHPFIYFDARTFIKAEVPIPGCKWRHIARGEILHGDHLWLFEKFEVAGPKGWIPLRTEFGPRADRVKFRFTTTKGTDVWNEVFENSVFGSLRKISIRLSDHFGWKEEEAGWFVLTGKTPAPPYFTTTVRSMRSFDHERDTFTIEVPAWATVETIGRILKDLQTQARMGKIQPISPKKLALVDFVSEGLTCGQSWEQIHLAWNQTHSKDKYPARDGAGFKKAYRDSYRLVMFGGIQWPGRIEKKYLPPAAVPDLEGRKPTKPTARRPGRRKQR